MTSVSYPLFLLVASLASALPQDIHPRQQQIATCPTTPAYVSLGNNGWSICSNSDYQINSVSMQKQTSVATCTQLCSTTNGCTVGVWDRVDSVCHLKGSPTSYPWVTSTRFDALKLDYKPTLGQAISKICPWGKTVYTSSGSAKFDICPFSDFIGTSSDIVWNINSNTACADLCAKASGCQKAVWDRLYNACHIKDKAGMFQWQISTQFETIYPIGIDPLAPVTSAVASTTKPPTTTSSSVSTTSLIVATSSAPATGGSSCPTSLQLVEAGGVGWAVCNNTDFQIPSNPITGNIADFKACSALCAQNTGCTTAVYDHQYKYCHIKGNPAATSLTYVASNQFDTIRSVFTPTTGTAITGCAWNPSNYTSGGITYQICPLSDFVGESVNIVAGYASATACADLCAITTNCTRAVWDSVDKYCHIKAPDATKLNWVQSNKFYTATRLATATTMNNTTRDGLDIGAKGNSAAIFGSCGVNAQHLFLGTQDKIFIVDKSEANPLKLANGFSATNAAFSLSSKTCRAMTASTNQFCAGGAVSGNGDWISGGGNPEQLNQNQGNGLRAIRRMTPCDDGSCNWGETGNGMQVDRWYPSSETTADGSVIFFGGYNAQVFLPDNPAGNAPSAEYVPSRGKPVSVPILARGFPFSCYPFVNLLSDGRYMIVANKEAVLWNPNDQSETRLAAVPNGPRNYPSGGFHAMLPLTPANGYTETIMYCGGNTAANYNDGCNQYGVPATSKCDIISPLKGASWKSNDMPGGRLMGNFMILPNNKLVVVNGARNGVQGFGCGVGDSMATGAANTVHMYDPDTNQWSALANQNVNRGYHASATLLPDGSVLMAGSSPHNDISNVGEFPSEFRLEKFYPPYYDAARPDNSKLPLSYSYGGPSFSITFASAAEANAAFVRIIRAGWSTHGNQLAQRSLELQRMVSGMTVTFSNLPTNRNLFPPGTALAFLVVNGIPSMGKFAKLG